MCKPRIWKIPKVLWISWFWAHDSCTNIQKYHKPQCDVSCNFTIAICWFLCWYLFIDISGSLGRTRNKMKPTRFPTFVDHLPRKNYRNYNKISEKFPFGNWGKLIEILRKPQNQKIKTHLNKSWLKVEETTNRHHQSVWFLPHGHHPSGWSVSFNRLTACVGDPVMGKADSGEENTPICKGW